MNIDVIIFLKWAVCMCVCECSPFIFLVSACNLAHFYRWEKMQKLQVTGKAKTSNLKQ